MAICAWVSGCGRIDYVLVSGVDAATQPVSVADGAGSEFGVVARPGLDATVLNGSVSLDMFLILDRALTPIDQGFDQATVDGPRVSVDLSNPDSLGQDSAQGVDSVISRDVGSPTIVGCADGEREGFLSLTTHPRIAACSGGFSLPGVVDLAGPACGRIAGDDSPNPAGAGCNAEDLCALGWHLCLDRRQVAAYSSTGCAGAADLPLQLFFVTSQRSAGGGACNDLGMGADDLFGCGTTGDAMGPACAPLDRRSNHQCMALSAPWNCAGNGNNEAETVVKPGPAAGGVLCCKD